MEAEFIEPTAGGRVRLVAIYVIAAVGYVAIDYFWPTLMTHVKGLGLCEQLPWLRSFLVAFAAVAVAIPATLAWHGYKILQVRQLPYPGALVFRRTKIKRGASVTAQAYFFVLLAVVILIVALVLLAKGWQHVFVLFESAPNCRVS